jgi:peroxiredoxin
VARSTDNEPAQDQWRQASLLGTRLPPLVLSSTEGPAGLSELSRDLLVLFIYPHATGLPDPPVPGWNSIPGARGCTAESCAFRDAQAEFEELGATIAGLSVQQVDDQRRFAARVGIKYRLISDPDRRLAAALDLPTFTLSGRTFYKRLTLVSVQGRVVNVFHPIPQPELHATEVLEWLVRHSSQPAL